MALSLRPSIGQRIPIGPSLLLGFVICALPLLGITELELDRRRIAGQYDVGEAYYVPPARVLHALSFGYNELAADLLWVRTIAYFADHFGGDHDFTHIKRYLDTTLALDPHFAEVYRFGSAMLMSRGARQTNEDVFNAIEITERAHELFPDDPLYPLRIGTYYLNELRTSSKTQRASWRKQAADWIRRATLIGANVPWLPSLAAKIYGEQGHRELAIRQLKELYLITPDEKMRSQIAGKLKALEDKQLARLQREAKELDERYRASELRFVPRDLSVLLELPGLPPFALQDLLVRP